MSQLIFTKEEIEAEHDYVMPHVEYDIQLHGGFDAQGNYLSPRTLHRWRAIEAWHDQLVVRDVPIVEASTDLLTEPNFPNVDQQVLLLRHGFEKSFWDSITITGLIEARGRALAEFTAPDFQSIVVEDISGMALGHMNKGLLTAHGWDEGGRPETDIGGHDVMWFVARDLLFGQDAYPIPEAPVSIGREKDEREMEQLPVEHETLITFLMNLLMIEVRAERAFQFYEAVIGSPETFADKSIEATHAIKLVNRIRLDESVHVAWLQSAISEFRSLTINTVDGAQVLGAEIIDPVWRKMVHWHAVEMHEVARPAAKAALRETLLDAKDGESLFAEFESLAA